MTNFKAGAIQEILGFNKTRYTYLYRQVGITPESLKVEGTGRSHEFSYRNLLQFAFSHYGMDMLSANQMKSLLGFLDDHGDNVFPYIFDIGGSTKGRIYLVKPINKDQEYKGYKVRTESPISGLNEFYFAGGEKEDFGKPDAITLEHMGNKISHYCAIDIGNIKRSIESEVFSRM